MTAKRSERKPIQCVCTNLKMASRLVGRTYDNALAAAGINVVQYSILINVSRYEPIAHMELASHLEMDRTTLYRAVAVLEKHGLLTTQPTGAGAAEALSLTAQGSKVTARAQQIWSGLHDGFVERFGAERLAALNAMLAEVRAHCRSL